MTDKKEKKIFEITIGGKKYIQKELLLYQVKQLGELLSSVDGTFLEKAMNDDIDIVKTIQTIGDNAARFAAIVLLPAEGKIEDWSIDAEEKYISFNAAISDFEQAVGNFFECNGFKERWESYQTKIAALKIPPAADEKKE